MWYVATWYIWHRRNRQFRLVSVVGTTRPSADRCDAAGGTATGGIGHSSGEQECQGLEHRTLKGWTVATPGLRGREEAVAGSPGV